MARKLIDPMFLLCCREKIADGNILTLVVPDKRAERELRAAFSDEELDFIRFEVGGADPAKGTT